mgnify:CR=1 FL=1
MHFVNMRISGENLDFEKIDRIIKMDNVKTLKKGDVHIKHGEKIIIQEDVWQCSCEIKDDVNLQKGIEDFICKIYEYHSFVNELSSSAYTSLWVTVYPEKVQLNFQLSNSMLRKLYNMGINFDLTIMNLNELYR